jgi:amidophosphoribosyltransferase
MLDRLGPKKIVIASSAPQIRYPDCYGIDMAKLGDFIAFKAAIELINERGMWQLLNDTYLAAIEENKKEIHEIQNAVKGIYAPFSDEEISNKIAELITEEDVEAEVCVVYQSIENLHKACPGNTGDWYFSGNYPTPGGNRVVNKALINYVEGINERAY